ncbi:MAG: polysaccharide biosynthesis protein [Oscillospiraceae bacterium]|nr:polysaccharide biosynthesis protein [Oscillospiraceae bacterium]
MSAPYKNKKSRFHFEHWHFISIALALFDAVAVNASFYIALWMRYDCQFWDIPYFYIDILKFFAPVYAVVCVLVFWRCKMYNTIWRFAGMHELYLAIVATAITFVFHIAGTIALAHLAHVDTYAPRMPITYYSIGIALQFIFTMGARFSYRVLLSFRKADMARTKRVMVIGAGAAGQMIVRDLNSNNSRGGDRVYCIIDDNQNKWNRYMEGVPVVGGRNDIFTAVKNYQIEKIILAIPSASIEQKREILSICGETECELKQVSVLYQQMGQIVDSNSIRDVSIEDLLGRESIKINMEEVFSFIKGKTILVTGGGGSIGSELCRQIAAHEAKTLIIFDIYENNAYDIQLELKEKYPELDLVTLIGSVRDSRRLEYVFDRYRPQLVFHAAAHKHVPLMEDSPCESIKNNVLGTYKTAYAAVKYGCERFVLISTDKAVNPTNVMGASKRLCEMVVQSFDKKIKSAQTALIPSMSSHTESICGETDCATEFVAVRFGNVLGSNGSVVPIFKKQIEKGGPVTVTHPDIIRYFMTVPEAVSLVLQAGVYARGGEIFVLDMGSPVKIDSLARNLIKLSGLKPDVDIKIEYTGLRPGEKLYEEKLMAAEGLEKTANDLIYVGHPIDFDADGFLGRMNELREAAYSNDENIRELIMDMAPTYRPDGRDLPEAAEKNLVDSNAALAGV